MSRRPALLSLLALLATPARAEEPDEAWEPPPEAAEAQAQPVPAPPPDGSESESPARAAWRARVRALSAGLPPPPLVVQRPRPVDPRQLAQSAPPSRPPVNEPAATLLGGKPLAPGQWGGGGWLGVPTLGIRLHRGLGPGWDVGVGYGGMYGQSHEVSLHARRGLTDGPVEWALGLEGSAVWFSARPSSPPSGARAFTGRRNFNLAPSVHVSNHVAGTSVRWLAFAQLVLSLDTEPVTVSPLGGVPPAVSLGWNLPVVGGGEWALGRDLVFQLLGGFEVHGRTGDVLGMPVLRLGLLFGS